MRTVERLTQRSSSHRLATPRVRAGREGRHVASLVLDRDRPPACQRCNRPVGRRRYTTTVTSVVATATTVTATATAVLFVVCAVAPLSLAALSLALAVDRRGDSRRCRW